MAADLRISTPFEQSHVALTSSLSAKQPLSPRPSVAVDSPERVKERELVMLTHKIVADAIQEENLQGTRHRWHLLVDQFVDGDVLVHASYRVGDVRPVNRRHYVAAEADLKAEIAALGRELSFPETVVQNTIKDFEARLLAELAVEVERLLA